MILWLRTCLFWDLASHSVVRLGSCCWYHCLCQLCHPAWLAASSSSWKQLPLLLPDIVGPESFIVHPDRMQLLQHFPPNPCEWGWQIPKFSSSEGSSLIMLFSSMKSRGRKSETLSFEKLCKDQRKNYLWLAQAFLDFCLLACISGWSVSDFSKLNLEVFVRVFCKPKT